jgi:LuxR family maltose regulon positive regulatory protein
MNDDPRRFAWLSLDPGDNDPIVLWNGILGALRLVEPGFGIAEAPSLRTPGTDLIRGPIPRLMNELEDIGKPIVLVLDDYHWLTDPVCLASIEYLIEREPANVSLVIASRVDPKLPLGRLRASGELVELRASDLSFTLDETERFLNGVLGLELLAPALDLLHERTEGWPAGLYLAYLSIREASDQAGFIEEFRGSSRHVADYLSEVVLDAVDDDMRAFLLSTSILERLSGPLCDAVMDTEGATAFLASLERSNSFLVPLDDRREWYRYHRLFADLLQDGLQRRDPERVPDLNRRAASWFKTAGDHGAAIRHLIDAGELEEATIVVCEHYLPTIEWGGFGTVARWLERFPRSWVVNDARLSIVEAWVMSFFNRQEEAEAALTHASAAAYEGPLPDGARSVDASVVLVRAGFPWGDVGRMLTAARKAYRLEGRDDSMWMVTVHVQLGWALCLAGDFGKARPYLERAARLAPMTGQWLNAFGAMCSLAWVCLEDDQTQEAERWAKEAVDIVEAHRLAETAPAGWAYATLGGVLATAGRSRQAEALLTRGIEQLRAGAQPLLLIQALLAHAKVRRALGANADARSLVTQAEDLLDDCSDPGILGEQVENVARIVARVPRGSHSYLDLTEREFEVLRLLEKGLSEREIGQTLYLSFNTIHSHTRSIYRKLDAASRAEALLHARERGFL